MQPLAGRLVLDFSTLLPGPMATLLLAEAGAEVIKVERPGTGEDMRGYEPKLGADSANFVLLNRGKRSLALDLKNEADLARLRPLLQRADVLMEQFRPGVMHRLGLGYEAVSRINPRIVYCSITGYGQTGPKRDRAGHDLNYQGDAGMLALSHGGAHPVVPPALVADIAGGAYPAVINILLALTERERTGQGCHLDVSMAENLFPFLYWSLGQGAATGRWPGDGDALVTGGTPRYRLYPTADGRVVAAAPIEDRFWPKFCEAIGLEPALRNDSIDPAATARAAAALIAAQPASHWRDVFARADCCCSVVATAAEGATDPHFAARGLFARRAGTTEANMAALPVPIAPIFRAPATDDPVPAPALGEANAEYA
jgi:alpha-methylacyl-CoA racemase